MIVWHDAELDPPKLTVKGPHGRPIRSEYVLVCFRNARGEVTMHVDTLTRFLGGYEWLYSGFDEPGRVTHWMPLPKPPKEKGEEMRMKYFVIREKDGEVYRKNGLFYGTAGVREFKSMSAASESAKTLARYHRERMRVDDEAGQTVYETTGAASNA